MSLNYVKFCFIIIAFLIFNPLPVNAKEDNTMSIQIDLSKRQLIVQQENREDIVFPISVGTELSPTPIGDYTITEKSRAWGGGFGSRWLGLDVSWGIYGIHGTNKPYLIGDNVSSGCIRMRNADVEQLFEMIPIGTSVQINGPITGTGKGEFKNLSKGSKGNLVQLVQNRLKAMGLYEGSIDGIFDYETESAVKEFQREYEISVTGGVAFREYLLLGLLE
jgi:hypothetical protein